MKFRKRDKPRILNKAFWMVLFIAGIMVLSTIGFIYTDTATSNLVYNSYKFKQVDNRWATKIGDTYKYFYFFPKEIEYLNATMQHLFKENNVIYITFDPVLSDISLIDLVRFELAEQFILTKTVFNGIANESSFYPNLPLVTCETANESEMVIYLRKNSTISIDVSERCIIAQGTGQDFLRLRDRILYSYFKIMP